MIKLDSSKSILPLQKKMTFTPRASQSERKRSLPQHVIALKQSVEKPNQQSSAHELTDQETQTNLGLGVKPKVQDEFRNLLLEFAINCLLDQPRDVVNYAADYFISMQEHRHTLLVKEYEEAQQNEAPPLVMEESSTAVSGVGGVAESKDSKTETIESEKELVVEEVGSQLGVDAGTMTQRNKSV